MAERQLTKEQKQWRAQDDAHTLASAQQITEDPARLKLAKVEAARMASDAAKRAQQLVTVASTKPMKKDSKAVAKVAKAADKAAKPKAAKQKVSRRKK